MNKIGYNGWNLDNVRINDFIILDNKICILVVILVDYVFFL